MSKEHKESSTHTDQRTPAEVNAKLAEGDGWTQDEDPICGWKWRSPNGTATTKPPDYCGDDKYMGMMLEKLLEWHGRMEFGHEFFMVHVAKRGKHKGKRLIEAIARAELARREGKK